MVVNTLAANEKYLVLHRDNLTISIQIQLSLKKRNVSEFFRTLLKFRLNFKHFERKDDLHSFFVSKTRDPENLFR